MSKIPFEAGFVASRRGFLKRSLGLGIGGLVAGCGRTVVGASVEQSAAAPGSGSGAGSSSPTDPTQPTNPPTDPTPPTNPPTDPPTNPPANPPTDPPALPNPQPAPSGSVAQVTATVTSNVVGPIDSTFAGFSFEKGELVSRIFSLRDPNVLTLFKALGPGVIRIGGSSSDVITWTPGGSGRTGGQISKVDIDSFASFVRASGWQVIYGINLATNTPAQAAEEAAYVANALGSSLYCFELGNEPDLYTNVFTAPDGSKIWNYAKFKSQWDLLSNAILARVGNATFAGPDAANNLATYAVPFARDTGAARLKILTQHHYRIHDRDPKTINFLLVTPDPVLTAGAPGVEPARLPTLKSAALAAGVPFRITEANSATNGGAAGVSDVYASALWALDFMFTVALGGARGVHFHGGDTAKYSPFNFGSEKVTEIKPLYYALLFFSKLGQGALLRSTVDSGGLNLSVYAIKTSSGVSVLFVNKEVSQSFKVALQLPASASAVTAIQLAGPGLTSTMGIEIQGASISLSTGLGTMAPAYTLPVSSSGATVYVPALTAVLVKAS